MKAKTKYLVIGLVLALNLNEAYSQTSNITFIDFNKLDVLYTYKSKLDEHAEDVMQNNEFERKDIGNEAPINCNPLLLNGQVLDYGTFDLNSKGLLTVVSGKPETAEAKPIPFYVSLRRNGKVLDNKQMPFLNKELYKVNLSDIFPFSKNGDLLIIKPAKAEDWRAKRILKLIGQGC